MSSTTVEKVELENVEESVTPSSEEEELTPVVTPKTWVVVAVSILVSYLRNIGLTALRFSP